MDQEMLQQNLADLPPEAQRQVMDFIAFLRNRYVGPRPRKPRKATGLEKESFIGMWRNREDLKDSSAWVRRVRQTEWVRSRG